MSLATAPWSKISLAVQPVANELAARYSSVAIGSVSLVILTVAIFAPLGRKLLTLRANES